MEEDKVDKRVVQDLLVWGLYLWFLRRKYLSKDLQVVGEWINNKFFFFKLQMILIFFGEVNMGLNRFLGRCQWRLVEFWLCVDFKMRGEWLEY